MKKNSLYHGHRFPAVVISCAVRWAAVAVPRMNSDKKRVGIFLSFAL